MFDFSEIAMTTIYVIVGNLVLTGFLIETLRRGGASRALTVSIAGALVSWQIFLIWRLAGDGLFPSNIGSVPFCLTLFGFVGVVCAATMVVMPLRKVLLSLPYESLLLPQGLRMFFGAGFLIEGVLGQLPKGFSIADGIFHILSAFLALKSGLLYAQRKDNIGEVWFANLFGLTDIVIVALGIPFALIAEVGPNHNMMYAAFFAAPLFVLFHVLSIIKLSLAKTQG